jgi:hypothetical protein
MELNPELKDLLLKKGPELLNFLKGQETKEKPKKSKIAPGQTIEIPETDIPQSDAPIPISMAAARRLLRKPRKPRTLSDESKAKMLANLQKGREALKKKKEMQAKATQAYVETQKKEPQVPTKKYVVKERKPKKAKLQPQEDYSDESEIDEEEYNQKLKHNEQLLKRIQQMQQQIQQQRIPPPPPLKRQRGYSLFY